MTRKEKIQNMLFRHFVSGRGNAGRTLPENEVVPSAGRMDQSRPVNQARWFDDYIRSSVSYSELHELCRVIIAHGGDEPAEMQNESCAMLEAVMQCVLDCFVPETPIIRTAFSLICLSDVRYKSGFARSMTALDTIMNVCSRMSASVCMLYIPALQMSMEALPYVFGSVKYALVPLLDDIRFPVNMQEDVIRYMKPELIDYMNKEGMFRKADPAAPGAAHSPANTEDESPELFRSYSPAGNAQQECCEKPEKPVQRFANPVEIKRFLDETVVGQDQAKISLSVAMANHLNAYRNNMKSPGCTTLLIGPSGSGKTMLAKRLAEYCDLPVAVVDASQITAEGWKGLDKGEAIAGIFKHEDPRKAAYGIVILDEFDKLCKSVRDSATGSYSRRDQETALGLLGGTPIRVSGNSFGASEVQEIPTENLFFILTGAFSQMESTEAVESAKGALGFGAVKAAPQEQDIRDRLIRFGLIPELVGRITDIAFTSPLSEEEAVDAVLAPESSFLKQYCELLEQSGKSLTVDREHVRTFVARSFRQGLGVRGVRNLLEEDLRPKIFRAFELDEPEVRL